MVFKNENDLKIYLLEQCREALKMAQDEIYHIINQFVKEFYRDYSPEMYERTFQLYNSLVKSDIVRIGNGYRAEVYFDYGTLEYLTGAKPSGKQVMDAAAYGEHGAYGLHVEYGRIGTSIWTDPMRILSNEAIQILKKRLIEAGIPIR